nr:hypothetical protein [Candidatus Sigynarchaeum springense]
SRRDTNRAPGRVFMSRWIGVVFIMFVEPLESPPHDEAGRVGVHITCPSRENDAIMGESRARCVVVQPESSKSGPGAARRWRGDDDIPDGQRVNPPPIIEITPGFRDLANKNPEIAELASLLQDCFSRLACFHEQQVSIPATIEFEAFVNPDDGPGAVPEPAVNLWYPSTEGGIEQAGGIIGLTRRVEALVKNHLARVAGTPEQFQRLRAIQQHYRFVIWSE